ncbi:glutathione S-transferase family protein [Sneathiella sp.]|uniref:glutathione S-transferase family protein n=1 Tax=Sneathiella sp. TaxID=1964365 RepID=UPI002620ABF5|nr:glutathione S-transferase family protein [Sneathiella sp.]MDF2369031.1 glutathione S-transferase family protein [Sneathiella sp.]
MLTIYGDVNSGNCYKAKLAAEQCGHAYDWRPVDILKKETHTEDFLAKNPNGKIPLLELEDGTCLSESNAILFFLARDTALFPADKLAQARVLQWLFFEQYSHEPYIAVARYIIRYLGRPAEMEETLQSKMAGGYKALQVMETQLAKTPFLTGESYSIADIGLFAYTHVAAEGDFDLSRFPAVLDWIDRVKQQPGYVPIG